MQTLDVVKRIWLMRTDGESRKPELNAWLDDDDDDDDDEEDDEEDFCISAFLFSYIYIYWKKKNKTSIYCSK